MQFTLKRRTVDSAKAKLKGKFLKGTICLHEGDDSIHQLVYSTDDSFNGRQMEMFSLLIML